ncbi:hypothetical protein [Mesorhizobium sp. 1M-11]|uniref:hypothetical protein n=1 Tax=Mesorhizobium sp. 1M-11 TaxID=1529006 RepID=UPI0006C75271|nr:hypothetical protein [Mesorhizobium sp. 1M-11]
MARHLIITICLGTTFFMMPATATLAAGETQLAQVQPRANSIGQADLQALRNQLQRQQFQQQQQIYREIDRQVVTPPQPVAPAVRQPCQSSARGGSAVGGCR